MQNKPLQIFKTPTAEKKIKEIIIFSARKWGKESAKKYALELEKSIISVAEGKIKTKINKEFSTRFCYCRAKKKVPGYFFITNFSIFLNKNR